MNAGHGRGAGPPAGPRQGWQGPRQGWQGGRPPLQRTAMLPRPSGAPDPRVRYVRGGAPAEPPAPPRPHRRRWPRRLLVLGLVLLAALVGFGIYVDTQLVRDDALLDYAGRPADTPGTNWLIVGSDSREDLTEQQEEQLATGNTAGKRTDTIMLLHTGSGPTMLVSLPRDSYVSIPGKGKNKLNAAFSFGGAPLLIRTVEQATGLRVDHYAEIGFGGFVSVVDAVGGVEMCVPEAIKDPKAGLDLTAGCQTMDGPTALGYVRTRATPRADLERIERQRAFLSALMAKATSPATLFNPFRFVPMCTGIAGAITVDRGDHVWHLLGLAFGLRAVSNGGITTTVPIGGTDTVGGSSVVRWDPAASKKLFDALGRDEAPPAGVVGG